MNRHPRIAFAVYLVSVASLSCWALYTVATAPAGTYFNHVRNAAAAASEADEPPAKCSCPECRNAGSTATHHASRCPCAKCETDRFYLRNGEKGPTK